ncbi:MAG: hypothetical protein GTN73_06075 [Candidatus Aminicenantes bacterium]|nr:hypothetical protein [Candidatus Aminicenantes bacterium]
MTFSISKQQLSDADEEFGYYPEELEKYMKESYEKMREEMMIYLEEFARRQIEKSKYPQYILIEKIDARKFKIKISVPSALYKEVKAESEIIKDKLEVEENAYLRKINKEQKKKEKAFLEKRGFRIIGDSIGVDYSLCVRNNRLRVKQVVERMKKIKKKMSLRQLLFLMSAFTQEITYGIPPFRENNKIISGFWAPPKVLANNFGDCDSKGVTFASMWTNFKRYPLILIKIPNHLFLGLAIPSIGRDEIMIKGLSYTLCEVTGPDKIPPGYITNYSRFYLEGGRFRYELIR